MENTVEERAERIPAAAEAARPPVKRKSSLERREHLIAFLFILPPILGFLIFTVASMLFSFVYSFQNYNTLTGASSWAGLKNYVNLFSHELFAPDFWNSVGNTAILLLSIPISMFLGLCLAGLLRMGDIKGAKVFQEL